MKNSLRLVRVELNDANKYISMYHRHHDPCVGHRFSIGVSRYDGNLLGVAICGRPVARLTNQRTVIEVNRLCTNGEPNCCSFLYAAAARISDMLGFHKIQSFILDNEHGKSLIAAGWIKVK